MTNTTTPKELIERVALAIRKIAWSETDGHEPLNAHDDAETLARAVIAAMPPASPEVIEALREAKAWLGLFQAPGRHLQQQVLRSSQAGIRDIGAQDILSMRQVYANIDRILAQIEGETK